MGSMVLTIAEISFGERGAFVITAYCIAFKISSARSIRTTFSATI
jgi:hypothetical protein